MFGPASILYELDQRKIIINVVNPDTKNNYTIINDEENIYIYDVNGKKLMRTIPAQKNWQCENQCLPRQRRAHDGIRIQPERKIYPFFD